MSVATYDNPATMRRECWDSGRIICSYSANVLVREGQIPARHFFFGANIGPWETGQLVGDPEAIKPAPGQGAKQEG